jgi:hypothetical protein
MLKYKQTHKHKRTHKHTNTNVHVHTSAFAWGKRERGVSNYNMLTHKRAQLTQNYTVTVGWRPNATAACPCHTETYPGRGISKYEQTHKHKRTHKHPHTNTHIHVHSSTFAYLTSSVCTKDAHTNIHDHVHAWFRNTHTNIHDHVHAWFRNTHVHTNTNTRTHT